MNDGVYPNNEEWGPITGPVHETPLLEHKASWVATGVNFDDRMEVHVLATTNKVTIRPNLKSMHRHSSTNDTLTSSMRPARYSVDNLVGSSKSVRSMASLRNQQRGGE